MYRCEHCKEEYRGGDSCPSCGTLRIEVACAAHPEKRALGRCIICGTAVCDDCNEGDRRAYLCSEHRDVRIIEGWAQLYTTTTEVQAQLIRENLQAEGIDARVYSQRDRIFSVDLGELSIVRILVPAWEYERGLEAIQDHTGVDGEVTFACPSCGEAHELGERECSSCGAALP